MRLSNVFCNVLAKRKCVQCVQCVQSVQCVHSTYMFYNLDYTLPKWNVFIDWFNVGIQYVDIKYVLHHVLQ